MAERQTAASTTQATEQLLRWVGEQTAGLRADTEVLWDSDPTAESRLSGLTVGYLITHLARCADRYADRLYEQRTGLVFPFDEVRRFDEETGAGRPGAVLLDDLLVALDRVEEELAAVGPDQWEEPVIGSIPLEWLTELVLHRSDLGADLDSFDASLVEAVLAAAVGRAPGLRLGDASLVVERDSPRTVVRGSPAALVAWVTKRLPAGSLTLSDGSSPPDLPDWQCPRLRSRAADSKEAACSST